MDVQIYARFHHLKITEVVLDFLLNQYPQIQAVDTRFEGAESLILLCYNTDGAKQLLEHSPFYYMNTKFVLIASKFNNFGKAPAFIWWRTKESLPIPPATYSGPIPIPGDTFV